MSQQMVAPDFFLQTQEAQFPLGQYTIQPDGTAYEYVKASGAVTAGFFVLIDQAGLAANMTTTNSPNTYQQKAGIAVRDLTDTYYGWVFRGGGTFQAVVANAVSAGSQLTSTGTGGNAGTGGTTIRGARNIDLGVTSTRVTVYLASKDTMVG